MLIMQGRATKGQTSLIGSQWQEQIFSSVRREFAGNRLIFKNLQRSRSKNKPCPQDVKSAKTCVQNNLVRTKVRTALALNTCLCTFDTIFDPLNEA